jgi:hypothetical protein
MKKVVLLIIGAVSVLAAIGVAGFIGFKLGWKHGRFDATSTHSVFILKQARAMSAGDKEKSEGWMRAVLVDIEADTLAFDDTWTHPNFRYAKAAVLLDLDSYWQTNPRRIPFGARVDATNIEKYGLGGGYAINQGRAAYEIMYSNALREARQLLPGRSTNH